MLETLVLIIIKLPHFIYQACLTTIFSFIASLNFLAVCPCYFPCSASVHVLFSFSYYNHNLEEEGLGDPQSSISQSAIF